MSLENALAGRAAPQLTLALPFGWPENDDPILWTFTEGSSVRSGEVPRLSDLPDGMKGATTIVWAPPEAVSLAEIRLPPMSDARAAKALPYALEDRLIDDPAEFHFAWKSLDEGRFAVAAIAVNRLSAIVEAFEAVALAPLAICPAPLSVPFIENTWSIRAAGRLLIARTGPLSGWVAPNTASFSNLMTSLVTDARAASRAPNRVLLIDGAHFPAGKLEELVSIESASSVPFELEPALMLNLLRGRFAPAWKLPAIALRLSPAAVMLAALAVTSVGANAWRWRTLNRLRHGQRRQITAILKQAFPGVSPGMDPAAQLDRRLADLRARSGVTSSEDFLPLLERFSDGFSSSGGAALRAVEYSDRALTATVLAPDFAAVEKIKQRYETGGLQAEVVSAVQSDGKTEIHLRLSHGGLNAAR